MCLVEKFQSTRCSLFGKRPAGWSLQKISWLQVGKCTTWRKICHDSISRSYTSALQVSSFGIVPVQAISKIAWTGDCNGTTMSMQPPRIICRGGTAPYEVRLAILIVSVQQRYGALISFVIKVQRTYLSMLNWDSMWKAKTRSFHSVLATCVLIFCCGKCRSLLRKADGTNHLLAKLVNHANKVSVWHSLYRQH